MMFRLIPLFAVLGFLTSCIDQDSVYTVNPDGSGKVEYRIKLRKAGGDWTDDDPAKALSQNVIRGAEGIAAWDEVSYRMSGSSAVEARMTGYFRDLNAVNLGRTIDAKGAETRIPLPKLTWDATGENQGQFSIRDSGEADINETVELKVDGEPVEPDESESDDDLSDGLSEIATMKFALDSSYRIEVVIDGTFSDASGLELEEGRAVYDYRLPDKKTATPAEKERIEKALGTGDEMERLVAGGIHENANLQKALFDREPPFTVRAAIEGESVDVESAIENAQFRVESKEVKEKLEGWTKLKSLELE